MPPHTQSKWIGCTASCLLLLIGLGCSLHKANKAFDEGRYDEAVLAYREILKASPSNITAKNGLRRASQRASDGHLEKSREAKRRGHFALEQKEVEAAILSDPTNAMALERLTEIQEEVREKQAEQDRANSIDALREQADSESLQLINPRSLEGVDLNFQRKTSLKEIFSTLSRASGVNIILHSDFKDAQVSVDLRGLPFQQILDTLMLQNELFYRVVDPKTIIILRDNSTNREKYENQAIKTFYLSHAAPDEVRQALSQFFSMGTGSLKPYVDKRQNAVVVRGRLKDVETATRIVTQMDKPKPEVMVYVELLEVTRTAAEKIGIIPTFDGVNPMPKIGITTKDGLSTTSNGNTSIGGININSADLRYIFPGIAIDALKRSGESRMLANPNLRITSDMEGSVNIGDEIPTLGSATISGGAPGGPNQPTSTGAIAVQNFSYTKVGVNVKVKPRVHHNGDVSMEINTVVSDVVPGGSPDRPRTSKRDIKTNVRLRDGEVAVFAGMLRDETIKSLEGIWGLSDIPFVGKLLSRKSTSNEKIDIILTLRADIVRKPDLKPADFEPFDPNLQAADSGPFAVKKKAIKPTAPPTPVPAPMPVTPLAAPDIRPVPAPAPPPPTPPNAAPAPLPTPVPMPPPAETAPPPPPPTPMPAPAAPAVDAPSPTRVPEGNVRLFLTPVFCPLAKGETVQLSLNVSNGSGLSSGSMDLQIDPKLKLLSMTPGDYLVGEGGTLDQTPEKNGIIQISFKRTGTASDSGTLAIITLKAVGGAGNAAALINKSCAMAGNKPVPTQAVSSLITIQ